MSKKQQKPHLMTALNHCKAMGHIRRKSIPDIASLYEYDCVLTCEEYQNQEGQKTQITYLHFTHKKKANSFKINIPDVAYCSNAYHEMHWQLSLDKQIEVVLGDRIDISMAVNCLNYLNPQIQATATQQFLQSKQQQKEEIKVEKKAKKQVLNLDTFDDENGDEDKRSNFGSDEDSLGGRQIEPITKVQVNTPHTYREIKDYGSRDHRALLDYSESTKILITCKLIDFFKNKDNRMKKVPQIREYLRGQRFNVPDKPLKEMIGELCISPIMDRIRGYLLKEIYLSEEQRLARREEEERMRAQRMGKQKQKRRRGKKQTKRNGGCNGFGDGQEDVMEETLSPFEQLQRKMTKKRNASKKTATKQVS